MSEAVNLSEKTVIELRKLAKELHVPLGAGISKQGIIDKLTAAMATSAEAAAEEPQSPAAPVQSAPEQPAAPAQPAYRQAYTAPKFSNKPAYQAPAYNRSAAPRPSAVEPQRTQTTRPVGYTHRFGPAAAHEPAQAHQDDDLRSVRTDPARPAYSADRRAPAADSSRFSQRSGYEQPQRPAYEQRPSYEQPQRPAYEQRSGYEQPQRPAYEQRSGYEQPQRPAYEQRSGYEQPQRPAYEQRSGYEQPQRPAYEQRPSYEQPQRPAPQVNEMLTASECPDGAGVLELHPDGYGFLRGETLLSSNRDIYVSAAQVRRFSLRDGDYVAGKIRPLRDGDKYSAMLYITQVNGVEPDMLAARPAFEHLTPIYPVRRINLEDAQGQTPDILRLMDLLTPIGFGQRALLQCPSGVDKKALLRALANVITANHPGAEVTAVLFNETPEDATMFRESVSCPVLATTFDVSPESHLRLAELVMERSMRLVESHKDVVLLVDSLTTLSKVYTAAAVQQGRQIPGMVSPASLYKAKRLFGAARCTREGGSLTVIAVMNTDTGSKVDETIINEFRGTANMELVLDAALQADGVNPPIDLLSSGTKRAEAIMTPAHIEGLKLLRSMLGDLRPAAVIPELVSMLDKAPTNEELLARLKDWAALMRK